LTDEDRLTSAGSVLGPSDYDTLRSLLKQAIPLHRTLGTPAAILSALSAIGFPNASLLEGQNSWGGTSWPSDEGWAVFRVVIPLTGQPVTARDISRIVSAANFFKPERCWLDSVAFMATPLVDAMPVPTDAVVGIFSQHDSMPTPIDVVVAPATPIADTRVVAPYHDAHYYRGGALGYGTVQPVLVDVVSVNGVPISAKG
jgi:hypothetical protein